MATVINIQDSSTPTNASVSSQAPETSVGANGVNIITQFYPAPSTTVSVEALVVPPISYVHTQGTPSSVWTIIHNLGWYPNVTIQDSAGSVVEGEIAYTSIAQLILTFNGAFTGKAYLS